MIVIRASSVYPSPSACLTPRQRAGSRLLPHDVLGLCPRFRGVCLGLIENCRVLTVLLLLLWSFLYRRLHTRTFRPFFPFHTNVRSYRHRHTHAHIHTYTYTHTHAHTHTHTHARTHVRTHAHTHTHTHILQINALLVTGWSNEKKENDRTENRRVDAFLVPPSLFSVSNISSSTLDSYI